MLFTRILSLMVLMSVTRQMAVLGQVNLTLLSTETTASSQKQVTFKGLSHSHETLPIAEEFDSLLTRRTFFSTIVTQQGERLRPRSVLSILEDVPQAQMIYLHSQILKPVGPLLIASGLVIGYIAVKGTKKTDYAKGIGTPSNPSPPDVLVDYTSRSLPMLAGGIGLVVGGLCLIEVANGLTGKSINLYNVSVAPGRSISGIQKARLCITASGRLGIEATF